MEVPGGLEFMGLQRVRHTWVTKQQQSIRQGCWESPANHQKLGIDKAGFHPAGCRGTTAPPTPGLPWERTNSCSLSHPAYGPWLQPCQSQAESGVDFTASSPCSENTLFWASVFHWSWSRPCSHETRSCGSFTSKDVSNHPDVESDVD